MFHVDRNLEFAFNDGNISAVLHTIAISHVQFHSALERNFSRELLVIIIISFQREKRKFLILERQVLQMAAFF